MSNSVFKQTVMHLMVGALSVSIGLVIFEGILSIALNNQEEKETKKELSQIVKQPVKESPAVVNTSEKPKQSVMDPVFSCTSDYYAIFNIDASTYCVKNPTLLMAHWGPPSSSWFRSDKGKFHAQMNDILPTDHCGCLAEQNEYHSNDANQVRNPVDHILFENKSAPITKWVCGDSCETLLKGEKHVF